MIGAHNFPTLRLQALSQSTNNKGVSSIERPDNKATYRYKDHNSHSYLIHYKFKLHSNTFYLHITETMVPSSFILVLGALPLAFAGYHPAASSTAVSAAAYPTGTATAASHTVAVGKDGLTFSPDTLRANIGDEITFQFFPKNHSVVRADFKNPCNPATAAEGIFSGFVPTAAGPSNQTFTITVKDDKPIWLYCSANRPSAHCAAGMVAVINPPLQGPNNLEGFKALAAKTNSSTNPNPAVVQGGKLKGSIAPQNGTSQNSTSTRAPVSSTAVPSSILSTGVLPSPVLPPNSASSLGSSTTSQPLQATNAASTLVVSTGAIGGLMAMIASLMM
jgi:plastocyanin